MNRVERRLRPRVRIVELLVVFAGAGIVGGTAVDLRAAPHGWGRSGGDRGPRIERPWLDSLVGLSGKLRARLVTRTRPAFAVAMMEEIFGDSCLTHPGVYPVNDTAIGSPFYFITLLPFTAKRRGRIGTYRMGTWPHERRGASDLPDGFVEVTPDNQDTPVSEHFRLRDFLTHDQRGVWPKYLVLSERLVDKLELVIADLEAHGVLVRRLVVMSGFRTPQYNLRGVGRAGGRARDSRHQYGDAADVFVDNDESERMDDLDHDGRVDWRDAVVIRDAVDRVEAAHPDLIGGVGVYRGTSTHGPFTHIDVRGVRARWQVR